jgi:flagellar basal-body rod protein FlgB
MAERNLLPTEDSMPTIFDDPVTRGLAQALDLRQRYHEIISSNLANVSTPGYKAQDLDFKDALKQAFEVAPADALPGDDARGRAVPDAAAPVRADGNSVDLDLQMAKLATNSGRYQALAALLRQRFQQLRLAIDGR